MGRPSWVPGKVSGEHPRPGRGDDGVDGLGNQVIQSGYQCADIVPAAQRGRELIISARLVGLAHFVAGKEGSATIDTPYRELLVPSDHLMPSGVAFLKQWSMGRSSESLGRPEIPADVDDCPQRFTGHAAVGRRG